MKNYQIVAQELMVIERAAWWNPRLRRIIKGAPLVVMFLLLNTRPLAIVPSAVLFGALDNGAQAMQRTEGVSPVLVQVIEGLVIIILLAFDATAWTTFREALWPPPAQAEKDQPTALARSVKHFEES
jgi:ABC-type uncharacterized transport system permease subunit